MELKLNIGDPKTGKTHNLSISERKPLHGKRLGETFRGETIDKTGYEFRITGGSDNAGFPMRSDVDGDGRRKVLLSGGVGYNPQRDGVRRRRTVSGNTVGPNTAQLNLIIEKHGSKPLDAPEESEKDESGEDGAEDGESSE